MLFNRQQLEAQSGILDIETESIDTLLPFDLVPGLERRLVYTAHSIHSNANLLGAHKFEQLVWNGNDPLVLPVRVECRGHRAEFHTGHLSPFDPSSVFGPATLDAFDRANVVYLLSDANPSLDPGPKVLYVNTFFEAMTGYSSSELVGQTPRIMQGSDTEPSVRAYIRESLSQWKSFETEITNYRKSGTRFKLQLNVTPIADSLGWWTHWFSVQRDVTKDQEENKWRIETSRQAGMAEVAGTVLHNVGNVLNSIGVSTSVLRESSKRSPDLKLRDLADFLTKKFETLNEKEIIQQLHKLPDYLAAIGKALEQEKRGMEDELESIINNVDHVKHVIQSQKTNAGTASLQGLILPGRLAEQAWNASRAHLESNGCSFSMQIDDGLSEILVDEHAVVQILTNLLKNAAEAMTESPQLDRLIQFRCWSSEDSVIFEVRDNGCGISPEMIDKVFRSGFTTKSTGTGYGLHASANAANNMGGNLRASSDGPGLGATFQLSLPRKLPAHLLSTQS